MKNSETLLVICPHFKTFIRDQVNYVAPFLDNVVIMMPFPYFYELVVKVPYLNRKFTFAKITIDSLYDLKLEKDYTLISPRFFTLPINVLRRRNYYLAAKSCVSMISKNRVDFSLIHTHFLGNGFIGAYLKNKYGKPLVVTAHGGDVYDLPFRDRWYNSLAKFVLTEADQVITVCKFNAGKLLSLGVSSDKLHVIPNGYDEHLFKPVSTVKARERLGLPQNKKILLSVGNLTDAKGHIYLINAMPLVLRKRKDVLLIIVGSGPLKELLRSMVRKYGLEDSVMLTGGKKHEEIPIWMNASDIFVLPSLQEGFSTVVPEAMACGKPIVATNVGGVPEAIIHNDLGILVNPGDSEELASAMLEALERRWNPEVILKHAEKYSWSNLAEQIVSVYRKALSN